MRKTCLLVLILVLIVAAPALARFGAGVRIGFLSSAFDFNAHASIYLTSNLEIEPAFDFFGGAGMISGTLKYNFPMSGVIPYIGGGLGFAFARGYGSLCIPMSGGVSFPLGAKFYLNVELRPVLFVGDWSHFSFGALAGFTYYF